MIKKLKQTIEDVTGVSVTYSEAEMMNIKADSNNRDTTYCYIEEYTSGTFDADERRKITDVEISFYRSVELHTDADTREEIRDILWTSVNQCVKELFNTSVVQEDITFEAGHNKFDANVVAITLNAKYREALC